MHNTTTEWLTTKQACEHLGIARRTLYNWLDEGLPVHRGRKKGSLRFDKAEVDDWLRSRCSDNEPGQGVA